MKLRKIAACFLALSIPFGIAGCGSTQASSSNTAVSSQTASQTQNPEKITFVLDWTPNTNHTGIYAAQKLGYFADEGLDVEIEQPPEDGAVSLVGSGKAQFGVGFQDSDIAPALSADTPVPITAIAALIQHNTSGIISLKSKGITSPKEMEGHTYATWDTPVEKAMVNYIIQKDGGDATKLKMVPCGNSFDAVAAIQSNVDTAWVYYAWDGLSAKVQGVETNYFAFKDIDPVFDCYTPVLIANNDFLKKEPETAKKFLSAVQKGYQYAIDHPDDAAEILMDAAPELRSNEALVKESQEWLASKYQDDAPQWGIIDASRWDGFYKWLYDNQLIEKEIPAGEGFSNDYLPNEK